MEIRVRGQLLRDYAAKFKGKEEDEVVTRVLSWASDKAPTIALDPLQLQRRTIEWLVEQLGTRESNAASVLRSLMGPADKELTVKRLEEVPGAVAAYGLKDKYPGLVAQVGAFGAIEMYAMTSATYWPYVKATKDEAAKEPYVDIHLQYAVEGRTKSDWIHVRSGYIPEEGIPLTALLKKLNYLPVNKSLMADYEKQKGRYLTAFQLYGQQAVVRGSIDPISSRDDSWWWKGRAITVSDPLRAKCILDNRVDRDSENDDDDEDIGELNEQMRERDYIVGKFTTYYLGEGDEAESKRERSYRSRNREGVTTPVKANIELPWRLYVKVFHLELKSWFRVHAANVALYKYKEDLADKLVLDTQTKDLIHLLTTDSDFEITDVIENKGSGVMVLLMGPPGTGKTLTAEVVAENTKKPLYKVSCAELGDAPSEIETNIGVVLQRAADWGCVLLLDEADVFVQKRGDDLHKNAVIATMLRQTEYYTGTLFLTTNRVDDVDEAFLSRCTAVVRYSLPAKKEALQLWLQFSKMHKLDKGWSKDEQVAFATQMAKRYPKLSGRTIHHALGLVARMKNAKKIERMDPEVVSLVMQFTPHTKEEQNVDERV